ncbi:MAG: response regulator transcription factor [Bacteroidota bacterium]
MNNSARILLVEDEESLAKGLEYNLTEEGYIVGWAKDGKRGIDAFRDSEYDLVILDIMLPYLDGFEVARQIRESDPKIPILMLTARADIRDKIHGLEIGADDYITKPFNLDELLLRVKGMLKRKEWYSSVNKSNPIFHFGKNEINFEKLIYVREGSEFPLTQREAMLMRYLIERKNQIVTREELLENVWQINPQIETRTVDNFIVRLRKYFEDDPSDPIFIKSVRSIGYTFSIE